MGKMKRSSGYLMTLLGLAGLGMAYHHHDDDDEQTEVYRQARAAYKARLLHEAKIKRNKAQGLTEYTYGDQTLWALNQKSAERKARKLGWIA